MKRVVKVLALIWLGTRLEHYSAKLLVKHGLAEMRPDGSFRKAPDYDEKIKAIVNRITP